MDEGNTAALTPCLTGDVHLTATVAGEKSLPSHYGSGDALQWFDEVLSLPVNGQGRTLVSNLIKSEAAQSNAVMFTFMLLQTVDATVTVAGGGLGRATFTLDPETWRIGALTMGLDAEISVMR